MAKRKASRRPALRGAGDLSLAEYGRVDLPGFSFKGLPGDTIREKAWSYVEALGMEPSADRGMVMHRVECVLEDSARTRGGRPSYPDEILAKLAQAES